MSGEAVLDRKGWWHLDLGGGASIAWYGCACGRPRPCTRWIAAGVLACELYPCGCADTRADSPPWSDGRCEYVAKKGQNYGKTVSKCKCWGRRRDERLPADCCAWHDLNPTYADIGVVSRARDAAIERLSERQEAPGGHRGTNPGGSGGPERVQVGGNGKSDDGQHPGLAGFGRARRADEVTCVCPTPWDGEKTKLGFHCVLCHTNWRSYADSVAHRRDWRNGPCKDPQEIVDCQTGDPLMGARMVAGMMVWGYA